jgi:hypothetical protein
VKRDGDPEGPIANAKVNIDSADVPLGFSTELWEKIMSGSNAGSMARAPLPGSAPGRSSV